MPGVVISGYYGYGNAGDEAVLEAIVRDLGREAPGAPITVLSGSPGATARQFGVAAVDRYDRAAVGKALDGADVLISGGGTLIQDASGTRSLLYYLGVIRAAQKRRLRVMLYGSGIGPLARWWNRRLARAVLDRVDLITLRDPGSARFLADLGVSAPPVTVTADPTFGHRPAPPEHVDSLLRSAGAPPGPYVAVSVRPWSAASGDGGAAAAVAAAADRAATLSGLPVVLLPMQPHVDREACAAVARRMRHAAAILPGGYSGPELLGVLGRAELCVGMRLHALIAAVAAAVPTVALAYDPKVMHLMELADPRGALPLAEAAGDRLALLVEEVWARRDGVRAHLRALAARLAERARHNAVLAAGLLRGPAG